MLLSCASNLKALCVSGCEVNESLLALPFSPSSSSSSSSYSPSFSSSSSSMYKDRHNSVQQVSQQLSLQYLDVSYGPADDHSLGHLFLAAPHLRHLNISYCTFGAIGYCTILLMSYFFNSNQCLIWLTSIFLFFLSIENRTVHLVQSPFKQYLQSLKIHGCKNLTQHDLLLIVNECTQLQHLGLMDLDYHQVTPMGKYKTCQLITFLSTF